MKKITSEDVYTEEVGALYDEASISRNPVSRDLLLNLASTHGVSAQSTVLDIGCANGGVSRELLALTGCTIEGVELLPLLVDMGSSQNKELGVSDRFTIQQGSITAIPFEDNYFDFIFCNDVIGLIDDLSLAMSECERVLKPGGKMLVYASFSTDQLSARESEELRTSLGIPELGLNLSHAEECIEGRFSIIEKIVIGSEFTQNSVEKNKEKSEAAENLLKVARLLTWRDEYIKKHGVKTYKIVLAEVKWTVFILLGKLEPTVFVAQKAKDEN